MPKDAEKYLQSCGLKNALYSFKAEDFTEGLFGPLSPCHSYQVRYDIMLFVNFVMCFLLLCLRCSSY